MFFILSYKFITVTFLDFFIFYISKHFVSRIQTLDPCIFMDL